jgi:hypothetical protein
MGQSVSYEAKTQNDIKRLLNAHGICYVPKVLNLTEIVAMISGTWDYFEHITKYDDVPIKVSDPASWSNINTLNPVSGMIFHDYSAGHSPHMWDLRQNEKIIDIWSQLLNCNYKDMLVSFDGFSFLLPPEHTNENWCDDKPMPYHLDQSLKVTEASGYQSFVTAYDIGKDDATLCFFDKSHLLTKEFVDEFGIMTNSDWVQFNTAHINWFKNKCTESCITCPAGSMVIWDSRLVHCGRKPKRGRSMPMYKCIAYLSYSPRNLASEDVIKKRKEGFHKKNTSNHYAHRAEFFYQNDTSEINEIDDQELYEIGMLLVGYTEDELRTYTR